MKKLHVILMMFVGFQGISLADHHANSKDTEEVTKAVHKMYEMVNNNKHWTSVISDKGSHQFWSSGGFLNFVTPEMGKSFPAIESNTIRPKHITVVPVEPGKVAVAMFYAEGSEKVVGRPPVDHYMTRATVVFAKENDSWKIRAMHWSPVSGGQGTSSISVKK
ncbi:MAG: hypothetical protein ACJ0K4_15135 [Verrucomicrobiales bacterium]